MGQSFDFGSASETWVVFGQRCFLCKEEEESIDHILLNCSLVRILWKLFDLFGIQWVHSAIVKEALLGWNGSFVGMYFLDDLEGKKLRAFDDKECSALSLKILS